jgi:Zn-finger nucleic acid-binding protein
MLLDRGKGMFLCNYCGSEAVPPMDDDGVQILSGTALPCPTCIQSRLADALMERQPLQYCPQCRGMLISLERFLPLVETLRGCQDRPAAYLSPRTNRDAGRTLACPLCEHAMQNHPYGGGGNVHIETCEACSMIWLDASELRRIVVAPDPRPVYSNYDAGSDFERP